MIRRPRFAGALRARLEPGAASVDRHPKLAEATT